MDSCDGLSTSHALPDCNRILGGKLLHRIEWTDGVLSRLVDGTLVNGATSAEWWSRQANGMRMDFSDQMRIGVLHRACVPPHLTHRACVPPHLTRGETITELRNRWMPRMPDGTPNADLRKEPDPTRRDIVRKARRDAEALVRTSALTVCREASLDVFEENADVISGVQWVSTLDDRTTPLCRALDGLEWTIPGYEPKGHGTPFPGASPHWNCRSIVVPVTKTWEELAKEAGGDAEFARRLDDVPEGVRASMGGPVPAGTTYETWFKEQSKERQMGILGPGRMAAYERGVTLKEMIDPSGNPKRLDVLAGNGTEPENPPKPSKELAEVQKWFDERLAFVLDGIKSKYEYTFGGKEYGMEYRPDFFAVGNLEAIGRQAVEDRAWLQNRKEELFKKLRGTDKEASGVAIALPNERGAQGWVKIGIRDDIVSDHMIGQVSKANEKWDWDGYCQYEPPLTPAQKLDMLLCHEIAHTQMWPHYKERRGGHGKTHEIKMLELMKILYPGFPGNHKRIRR